MRSDSYTQFEQVTVNYEDNSILDTKHLKNYVASEDPHTRKKHRTM